MQLIKYTLLIITHKKINTFICDKRFLKTTHVKNETDKRYQDRDRKFHEPLVYKTLLNRLINKPFRMKKYFFKFRKSSLTFEQLLLLYFSYLASSTIEKVVVSVEGLPHCTEYVAMA